MGMEATGRVHAIFEEKRMSERFTKREFVLELVDNPKYPQTVLFQVTGDRLSQLYGLNVGDEVRVEFNLRGREWRSPQGETKYFNSLEAWRIEPKSGGARGGNAGGRQRQPADRHASRNATSGGGGGDGPDDDIPFTSCDPVHEPSPIAKVLR